MSNAPSVTSAALFRNSNEWVPYDVNYDSSFLIVIDGKMTVSDFDGVIDALRSYNVDLHTYEEYDRLLPTVYALTYKGILVEMYALVTNDWLDADAYLVQLWRGMRQDEKLVGVFHKHPNADNEPASGGMSEDEHVLDENGFCTIEHEEHDSSE